MTSIAALDPLLWARPWAFGLLLPLLVPTLRRRLFDAVQNGGPTLLHPGLHGLLQARPGVGRHAWRRALAMLAWCCWVIALAGPQLPGRWIQTQPRGRDIVVVLDTSLTMSIDDWRWNGRPAQRLDVVKQVFAAFARQRAGDRFGIIAFASQAATVQAPTLDRRLATTMLERVRVGMLGQDTALGDALGLALRQVKMRNALPPLVIVYSDNGPSNSGQLSPAQALALARSLGVIIDTVQIGDAPARGITYQVPAYAGPQPDLKLLAESSGGHAYYAADAGSLQQAARQIDALAPTVTPPPTRRSRLDLAIWPLVCGMLLWALAGWPARESRR